MRVLVVYDSQFGNTEKVAEAIGSEVDAQVVRAAAAKPEQLKGLDLLIVGSATQKFTALQATKKLLKGLAPGALRGVNVAAFDTRFRAEDIEKVKVLAFFVRIFGFAAEPMAKWLEKAGGELMVPPEGFFVGETKGPLLEGEMERAAEWAAGIAAKITST